jgi:hypothetical protein
MIHWKSSDIGDTRKCSEEDWKRGYLGRSIAVKMVNSCVAVPMGIAYGASRYVLVEAPWNGVSFSMRVPYKDVHFYISRGGGFNEQMLQATYMTNALRHIANIVISFVPFVCPEDKKFPTIDSDRLLLDFYNTDGLSYNVKVVAWTAVRDALEAGKDGNDDAVIGRIGSGDEEKWVGISPRFLMDAP